MSISAFFTIVALTATAAVSGTCPEKPLGALREYQGTCIDFVNTPVYQEAAKEMCTDNSGHLLVIDSKEKQAWLEKTLLEDIQWIDKNFIQQQPALWLGIGRERTTSTSGTWLIDNGKANDDVSPLKYENWDAGEPSPNKNRDCAVFGYQSKFKWKAIFCNVGPYTYPFVCEYDQKSGLFGTWTSTTIAIVVVSLLSLLVLIGIVLFYKGYMRRRALERRLHDEVSHDYYPDEYHIKNTDNDINGDQNNLSTNNNTPTHYTPITHLPPGIHSHHDFNILSDSGNCLDKLRTKDLSFIGYCTLQAPYSPPNTTNDSPPPSYVEPSAPSETCSVYIEDDGESNSSENSPLHASQVSANG